MSVKDAEAMCNLADIVGQHKDEDILLVVSAMGKTTNMFQRRLWPISVNTDGNSIWKPSTEVIVYHDGIIQNGLFGEGCQPRFWGEHSGSFSSNSGETVKDQRPL